MSSDNLSTRERILNATRTLLEANQGTGVRMSDIAKMSGVSRQAVYLHFPTRTDLLIATTRHLDEINNVDAILVESRTAETGEVRLNAFIDAWGNYIPRIYGIAKALMAMSDTDDAADAAWRERTHAVRHGCAAAVRALHRDGRLSADLTPDQATDILWTLLSVRNWEQLTAECGLSQDAYIETMKRMAQKTLLSE